VGGLPVGTEQSGGCAPWPTAEEDPPATARITSPWSSPAARLGVFCLEETLFCFTFSRVVSRVIGRRSEHVQPDPAQKSQAWAADFGPMGGPGQVDLGPTV
jgi:hypothetical protein